MALISFRVQNAANRSEPRRINALHNVQKIKPDSSGLVPATHENQRLSVRLGKIALSGHKACSWVAGQPALRPRFRADRGGPAMTKFGGCVDA